MLDRIMLIKVEETSCIVHENINYLTITHIDVMGYIHVTLHLRCVAWIHVVIW